MYIWDEIMTYWCIDNLENGGYSSGTAVPYKIYGVTPYPGVRVDTFVGLQL